MLWLHQKIYQTVLQNKDMQKGMYLYRHNVVKYQTMEQVERCWFENVKMKRFFQLIDIYSLEAMALLCI